MLDLFLIMFIAALPYALKPGPHFMALLSLAMAHKWRAFFQFWIAAIIASSLNYFLLLGGLTLIPEKAGFVYILIKSLAAMFFISIGVKDLANIQAINQTDIAEKEKQARNEGFWRNIITGVLTAFSNPYAIMFVLVGIPAIVGQASFSILEIVVIRGAVIATDILITAAFCIPILLAKNYLSDTIVMRMKIVSGIAMIGIGGYILFSMMTQWDLYGSGLL